MNLRLPSLFTRRSNSSQFANIEDYEDVKNVIVRALDADENYNLLLCGPPASSKPLFPEPSRTNYLTSWNLDA